MYISKDYYNKRVDIKPLSIMDQPTFANLLNLPPEVHKMILQQMHWGPPRNREGSPLHDALKNNSSINIINSLIEGDKEATNVRDKDGYIPLHVALNSSCFMAKRYTPNLPHQGQAVKMGIQPYTNNMAHIMVRDKKSVDVVEKLLHAYPGSLYSETENRHVLTRAWKGKTPLCLAIDNCVCKGVIKTLIKHDPNIVKTLSINIDLQGYNGLDSLQYSDSDESVTGHYAPMLPVHLAANTNSDFHILKLLLKSFPESIEIQDDRYKNTPLHWALSHHADSSVLYDEGNHIKIVAYLLKKCPTVTKIKNRKGQLPIDMEITRHIQHATFYSNKREKKAFGFLPGTYFKSVLNPLILITLTRMYLNNDYPDQNGNVNWEADTSTLQENMQFKPPPENIEDSEIPPENIRDRALSLIQEIQLHENDMENDKSGRSVMEVISRFVRYKWAREECALSPKFFYYWKQINLHEVLQVNDKF